DLSPRSTCRAATGERAPHPCPATAAPRIRAGSDRRAGGLYQRWKVHAVQRSHASRGPRLAADVCHSRSHNPRRRSALEAHVSDASSRLSTEQDAQVEIVLKELEAEKKPRLRVMNKVDLLDVEVAESLVRDAHRDDANTVYVSAAEGVGLEKLLARIDALIDEDRVSRVHLRIPQKEGKTLALL